MVPEPDGLFANVTNNRCPDYRGRLNQDAEFWLDGEALGPEAVHKPGEVLVYKEMRSAASNGKFGFGFGLEGWHWQERSQQLPCRMDQLRRASGRS